MNEKRGTQTMSEELKYNEPWILQRADPYVYRHTDGNYYFTASVPAYDRIVLRRSETLAGLKDAEEVTVWEKHKKGIMSEHIWAPELHYLDGKWYIYFAGGDKDDIWAIRPYVLECADADPITGTWTEKGKMGRANEDEFSFEAFSLDATVFENKGKHYYVCRKSRCRQTDFQSLYWRNGIPVQTENGSGIAYHTRL